MTHRTPAQILLTAVERAGQDGTLSPVEARAALKELQRTQKINVEAAISVLDNALGRSTKAAAWQDLQLAKRDLVLIQFARGLMTVDERDAEIERIAGEQGPLKPLSDGQLRVQRH